MNHGHGIAMEGISTIWVIIIAAVIIILLVWILTRTGTSERTKLEANKEDSPLDILQKRYAMGQITKEEFEEMKQDLMEE